MATTEDTLRLVRELRAEVAQITDQRARQLVQAWVQAWDVVSGDFTDTVNELLAITPGEWPTAAQITRVLRARDLLNITQTRLETLAADAAVAISQDAAATAALGADPTLYTTMLPPGAGVVAGFNRVPVDAMDAIVSRITEQITSLTRPLSAEATQAMRLALIRGVAVGDNPRTVAAEMLARVEGAFNGGLTRALTISRTETLDAYRAGSRASRAANTDVVTGWRWLCDLSSRTCPACLSKNGSVHAATDPGPEGHPNCRCTAVPTTASWGDLGFTDIPEPADTFPDSRAWFDAQDPTVQAQIMGPARLAALRSGAASWEQLATKQTNTGWRDSWNTTPVRTLTA